MSYTRGIVKKIIVREPKDGQFGKFANYGMQLETPTGEVWVNGTANEDKYKHVCLVKDANHAEVTEGMEVECMYEVKDGFNNLDKKTLKIVGASPVLGEQPKPKEEQTIIVDTDANIRASCVASAVKSFDHLKDTPFRRELVVDIAEYYFNYCKQGK